MEEMSLNDGYNQWRIQEHSDLTTLVQNRLEHIQNPQDCNAARIAKCQLNNFNCGWGCQVHHVAECLTIAYGTTRTLIFNSTKFEYTPEGLEKVLQPFSLTCNGKSFDESEISSDPNKIEVTKILKLGNTFDLIQIKPRVKYLPSAIPADLAERLKRLEVNPSAWWMGQLKKYILRYQPEVLEAIERTQKKLSFKNPIVGIQIRRTDKLTLKEGESYPIERYMSFAEEYFDQLEISGSLEKRRIFLATEDPKVFREIQEKYPNYEIIFNMEASKEAESRQTRYSLSSLFGIITDIFLLSKSDFLVCTFTSNVGRLAYELMQTERPDASHRVKSLDYRYQNFAENDRKFKVLLPHVPRSFQEVEIEKEHDVIVHYDFEKNGLFRLKNNGMGKSGFVPAYKVEEIVETVDFPTYERQNYQVNLNSGHGTSLQYKRTNFK